MRDELLATKNFQFDKHILSNGLTILTEKHPNSFGVSVGVWIDVGTRDEPEHWMGMSHMVEHLVFKGTKNRTAYQIVRDLESVGGDINAYTTREFTCYHTQTLKKDLALSLDVLGDLVTQPLFSKTDFEREREVILQEVYMSSDQLEDYIFDLFFDRIYKGHALAWPILGTEETIQAIKIENVRTFFEYWYRPENMILTVTGPLDHDHVVKEAEKFLGSIPPGTVTHKREVPPFRTIRESLFKPAEQVHVLMGWPTASYRDDLRFESYIVNTCLGGGMTSRLYQNIREEKGLAYSIASSLNSYHDSGLAFVYGATTKDKVPELVEEVLKELGRLKDEGLSSEELDLFKNQVKGQILLGSDDMDNRMSSLALNEMIYKSYRSIPYVIEKIEAVTVESVRDYLKNDFPWEDYSMFLLGDTDDESLQKWLLSIQPQSK